MVDSIINWFINLVKSLPEEIMKGIMISFLLFLIRLLMDKVKKVNKVFIHFIHFISKGNFEISTKMILLDSPDYYVQGRKVKSKSTKTTTSNDDVYGLVFIGIIGSIIIVSLFIKYVDIISLILKWYAVIPLIISMIILFFMVFVKNVHKVTIKFIIFSIIISTLTLYYGINLKEMSLSMSSSIKQTNIFILSFYKIIGISIGVLQQLIPYILLVRSFIVFIDRKLKNKNKIIMNFIAKTKGYESIKVLIFLTIILTCLSYLLTLDEFVKLILTFNTK
ncbi:hypothetical protein [Staphylococcus pasteuri]|uniref:hypothetical protein n=1 Tax=Staphylococcus pasteuri TaxID=45972 RepID=UPI0032601C36